MASLFDVAGDLRKMFGCSSSKRADATTAGTSKDGGAVNKRRTFPELTGVRALMSIWMIVFHSLFYISYFYEQQPFEDFVREGVMGYLMTGYTGVDVFFCLTGFLIAYPLLKKTDKLPTLSLKTYYYKRFFVRIYPPLVCCLAIHNWALFYNGQYALSDVKSPILRKITRDSFEGATMQPSLGFLTPANLLFLNNYVPFGGCMGWTWTLAVQGQFYVVFPYLLKKLGAGRRLLFTCCFALVAISAYRAAIYFGCEQYLDHMPRVVAWNQKEFEDFYVGFVYYYTPTLMRVGTVITGVLMAMAQVHLDDRGSFPLGSVSSSLLAAGAFVVLAQHIQWRTGWVYATFLNLGAVPWAMACCYTLLIAMNKAGPVGRALSWVLSLNVWTPFASLSYLTYLLHPMVFIKWAATLGAPPLTREGWLHYLAPAALVIYSSAALLFVLVEQPAARYFRNRLLRSQQAEASKKKA